MLSGRADLPVAPVWCPGGGCEQADSPLAPSNGALLTFVLLQSHYKVRDISFPSGRLLPDTVEGMMLKSRSPGS